MRICIATNDGKTIASRAAMAQYFYIYENNKLVEKVKNPYAELGRGRGRAVANLLLEKNINVFVAEHIGENLKESLTLRGVKIVEKAGEVEEILNQYK